MKIWFASLTAALALNNASAQLLSPESLQYSFLGAMIGGSVGGDYHCGHYHWSGENAALGAGVGLIAGTLLGQARQQQSQNAPSASPPTAYGYSYGYNPSPAKPAASRPNYALSGTLVGAASGALIGEGVSGRPGQGAAIGAATGLVLGGIAEHNARKRETPPPANDSAPAPSSGAKSAWTSTPVAYNRVPDAPRVADAPTF